jgi:hypothetical protein
MEFHFHYGTQAGLISRGRVTLAHSEVEDNNGVLLFNVVNPPTFNEDNDVVLFKVENPLIFNEVINIALLLTNNSFKFENPLTFNFEKNSCIIRCNFICISIPDLFQYLDSFFLCLFIYLVFLLHLYEL